jgi:mannosyltransferase OCH1-like enzyme
MQLFQYWHEARGPDDVEAALAVVAPANPGLVVRRFHHDSAAGYIASRYGARASAAFRACAVPAMQADLFRYCAVLAEGGFWLDADHRCASPLADLLPAGAGGVVFQRDNANVVNGCFGVREAGHPLLAAALEIALRGIEARFVEDVWLTTGPGIFTYLHLISRMTPEERAHLDYDHIGAAVTFSMRLCDAVAASIPGDIQALFAGVHVAPFSEFELACPSVPLAYKDGTNHWVAWQGSIFR